MSDENTNQNQKQINIKEIFTDTVLESVVLTREGAQDPNSKQNALNHESPKIDLFQNTQGRYKKQFKALSEAIRRLKRRGNYYYISQMDPQSQAIVKTACKPILQEAEE